VSEQTLDNQFETPDFSEEQKRDLGFGSIVAGKSRQRLLNPDGSFNVTRTGLSFLTSLNLYHTLLTMRWRIFLCLMLLLFFVSNIVFGLLYSTLGAEALVDTSGDPTMSLFVRGFFFSVQTFATIGYGTIHPVGITANLLVTIESYYSLLANALITGVVFARFARPTARVVFSDKAVIAPYKNITGLMFRIVNGRRNQLTEVGAQVIMKIVGHARAFRGLIRRAVVVDIDRRVRKGGAHALNDGRDRRLLVQARDQHRDAAGG